MENDLKQDLKNDFDETCKALIPYIEALVDAISRTPFKDNLMGMGFSGCDGYFCMSTAVEPYVMDLTRMRYGAEPLLTFSYHVKEENQENG